VTGFLENIQHYFFETLVFEKSLCLPDSSGLLAL